MTRQAVLHLDGDAFFASIEQALDPSLKGRPVMTGGERGIVAAFSYEAKARGITRGMQTWQARKICPELVVRSSDYRTYQIFSRRAARIIRRHVAQVEEYGIDECFAIMPGASLDEAEAVARRVQETLMRELGVGYSIGVAPTKSLAKVGSKWNKPYGITVVRDQAREEMLRALPVGSLWGVGRRMAPRLMALGIHTALDLARADVGWAAAHLDKPYLAMWSELQGIPALGSDHHREKRGSVQVSRTFWPASAKRAAVWSQLCGNVERACERLRKERLLARHVSVLLKKQDFSYRDAHARLPFPSAYPDDVLAVVEELFDRLFQDGDGYRATGITLAETSGEESRQQGLFPRLEPELARLYASVDALNARQKVVWLGASVRKERRERVFRLPLLGGSAG